MKPITLLILLPVCAGLVMADESASGIPLPTGKAITPTAATGAILQDLNPGHPSAPDIRASQASALSVSPDGRMLAVLTSGFNRHPGADGKDSPELSTEYVFLFDISGPQPKQTQAFPIPNAYYGLAWTPTSDRLFASGGKDDTVVEFIRNGSGFAAGRTLQLGHKAGIGLDTKPMAGSLAVSPDGTRLLVANLLNDSVSLIDIVSGRVVAEQDLRPGIIDPKLHGTPGGSYPRAVAWISPTRGYVASERDREIIELSINRTKIRTGKRMPVHGQPVALVANRKGTRLYAALDVSDQVAIFETAHNTLIEEFNVIAPEAIYQNVSKLGGANSNALALTPDERTLLVSNGGENAVAVVHLSDGERKSAVVGLVPTGWYPTGVATSKNGAAWYVANAKSEVGPSVGWCTSVDPVTHTCVTKNPPGDHYAENGHFMLRAHDWQIMQLQKAGLLSMPAPQSLELARLTKQVAHNNHFDNPEVAAKDRQLFTFLREHIHHVIYIVKENRTYDQILGDLEIGNGDPKLTLFPEKLSPNHHAIARGFTTLDNFLVSGEGSWTGWDWSASARTNDYTDRVDIISLAGRAASADYFGVNRGLNTTYATSAERRAEYAQSPSDPDVLPGNRSIDEVDGPGGEEGKGYIWDAVLRKGLTVRNYGFFPFSTPAVPMLHDPFEQKVKVYFPANKSLAPFSDPYYHLWGASFPDYWRYREWKREFDGFCASKTLPNLMLMQLGNDHLGDFSNAIDDVNTPETQMADNDYSLGLIIEAVANSPFANDTLVVSIEDDTWDGPDHVNAFRSVALLAGPYVRQHALVSTRYNTVSIIRTIEEVLGLGPIGLNDALAAPMSEVFDPAAATWSYKAIVPDVLHSTKLPLPPADHAALDVPKHSAAYWTKAMADQDFSSVDRGNPTTFNRALWRGLKGNTPYPQSEDKR